jgi:hypothetical protein
VTDFDDIMDDLFHGCAFAAFVEEAAKAGGKPCPELTRRRAYRYYEDALAERHGRRIPENHCPKSESVAMWKQGV